MTTNATNDITVLRESLLCVTNLFEDLLNNGIPNPCAFRDDKSYWEWWDQQHKAIEEAEQALLHADQLIKTKREG